MTKIGLPLAAAGILAAACTTGAAGTTSAAAPAQAGARVSASTSAATIMVTNGHLTDGTGRTVYLWAADPAGKSICNGACTSLWPPVQATGTPMAGPGVDAAKLTTIKRADGTSQLAYAGHALYYFAPDKSAGQTSGQGSNGFGAKWWEVGPSGQAITSASGSSSTPRSTAPSATGGGYGY